MSFSARFLKGVYTIVMELTGNTASARARFRATESRDVPKRGSWGVYGEAIGNPKFFIGTNPKDSEFLQAADEFASAHEELLRVLAKL